MRYMNLRLTYLLTKHRHTSFPLYFQPAYSVHRLTVALCQFPATPQSQRLSDDINDSKIIIRIYSQRLLTRNDCLLSDEQRPRRPIQVVESADSQTYRHIQTQTARTASNANSDAMGGWDWDGFFRRHRHADHQQPASQQAAGLAAQVDGRMKIPLRYETTFRRVPPPQGCIPKEIPRIRDHRDACSCSLT